MKKMGMAIVTSAVLLSAAACGQANSANRTPETPAKVYFIREINAQNLVKITRPSAAKPKAKWLSNSRPESRAATISSSRR